MANPIDIVISKEALAEIDKAISKVGALDKEIQSTAQSFISNSKKMASALSSITPVDVSESITDNSKLTAELDRQSKVIQGLETQIKRLSQVRATNNKMSAEEAVNQRILNKNALDQAKTVSNLVGAYDKLSLAHQKAFKNAQNMGAQYGITSDKFLKASEKANKLDSELKTLDATLGKHNRNVGNYASGYNALGNSINQLSREAPAFANSMNTGFMAISNNLPSLFDAIKGINLQLKEAKENALPAAQAQGALAREQAILSGATEEAADKIAEQTKELALSSAEGVRGRGVLRQLAGAFFSWQTLISVGITLLTVYGGKFIEYISNLSEGTKAQKALNDAQKEGNKNAYKEAGQLDILYKIATNVNLTLEQRKKAVDKLQDQYPSYFKNISDEVIMNGRARNSYLSLRDAIFASARAKAIQVELEKRAEGRIEKEIAITEELADAEKELNRLRKTGSDLVIQGSAQDKVATQRVSNKDLIIAQERLVLLKRKELQKLEKDALEEDKILLDAQAKNEKQSEKLEADRIKAPKEGKEKGIRAERAKKEAIELKSVADTISQINAKIAELQQKATVGEGKSLLGMTDEEIKKYKEENSIVIAQAKEDLEDLIELKKQLNALPTASTTILQPVKKEDVENLKQLSQEMKDYLSNFTSDFINQSGFTNTFKILNNEIDGFGEKASVTFNAIAESAQEAFNFISNASQANFDAEYSRLESQKENALKFAGEGTAARKKIEDDYEKKKKEVANRENKAKQKQAIFNIAIDTAQAVVASFIKDPTGITAAIIAALGAAQIGIVAAQKIPQYFDGGVHGGGLAMINDAGGSNYVETVVTPDGKVQQFKGRDVVADLPKGTEIFTPEQWQQKELEYMLNSRGVMLNNQVSNGMTAEEMDRILSKHFSKIQISKTVYDKKGFTSYVEYQGNKTIRNANRASGTGFNV